MYAGLMSLSSDFKDLTFLQQFHGSSKSFLRNHIHQRPGRNPEQRISFVFHSEHVPCIIILKY